MKNQKNTPKKPKKLAGNDEIDSSNTPQKIIIHCKSDKLLDPTDLKNHPKNRNKHGQDQIERLAELYKFHGVRHPIIISKLSGFIVAGHGRKLAAILAGITKYPVVFQDFETVDHEYAFLQADNAIALWAELDKSQINMDLGDLGPDFDLTMLGIKGFTLDMFEKDTKNTGTELNLDDFEKFEHKCPKCSFEWNSSES